MTIMWIFTFVTTGATNLKRDRRFLSHPDITPFGRVPDQLPNPVNLSLHGKHREEQENQAGISLAEPSSDKSLQIKIHRGTRWIMRESGCFSEPIDFISMLLWYLTGEVI